MAKTVMMTLSILRTAQHEPERAAGGSPAILMLDFRKAYGTVARDFLYAALKRFGFSAEFVNMIRKLHEGTTAQFLVNGEVSKALPVETGIRQGCPLAPLLFILAAEVLAIAITSDPEITGIEIPNGGGERHQFSAFVDDSTVFLEQAQQLPRVMEILKQFGDLAGLRVQPAKSKLVFLNSAIEQESYYGIPVLAHGDTVRYLGYGVGTGDMTVTNWAGRIRSIQRRLATAAQLATSMENRVTILNVIMLPSILFTAAVFDMPKWAEAQLYNLQRNFLWHHSTSTERAKHKISPDLLYTPKLAGGVGLASIALACKTQKMKHAILWLTQKKDRYFAAWKSWAFRDASREWTRGISPLIDNKRRSEMTQGTPGDVLQQMIGSWIGHRLELSGEERLDRKTTMVRLAQSAISWETDGVWFIELGDFVPSAPQVMTQEQEAFWPSYQWCSNPWIQDAEGKVLEPRKYSRIQVCTLEELHIVRTGVHTYTMKVPTVQGEAHTPTKMHRWAVAILSATPTLAIGEQLVVSNSFQLRHQDSLELANKYEWTLREPGKMYGRLITDQSVDGDGILLLQQPDGIHWKVEEGFQSSQRLLGDRSKLEHGQTAGELVFQAHPAIHGFPWSVADSVMNKNILKAIKRQPFRNFKGVGSGLSTVINSLQHRAQESDWHAAVLQQTPAELWAHNNELTEYQVWVAYRAATCQLNLFHEDRPRDNSCRKSQGCQGVKETLEYIFWDCPAAQACWIKLVSHWTGWKIDNKTIKRFKEACANRQAPWLTLVMKGRLQEFEPDAAEEMMDMWKRIWYISSSVCLTSVWMQRNRVIFEHADISLEQAAQEYWSTCVRQLHALAKRERRNTTTRIRGTRLMLGLQLLHRQPREAPSQVDTWTPAQDVKLPVLVTRLQTYQKSYTR